MSIEKADSKIFMNKQRVKNSQGILTKNKARGILLLNIKTSRENVVLVQVQANNPPKQKRNRTTHKRSHNLLKRHTTHGIRDMP